MEPDKVQQWQRNVLNAFLEIREKLAAQDRAIEDLQRSAGVQDRALFWLTLLVLFGIGLQVVWIMLKLWLDRRAEARVKTLVDIHQKEGRETDRSKRTLVSVGEEIAETSANAADLAAKAALQVKRSATKMEEAKELVANEVHQINQRVDVMDRKLDALVRHLCPGGLPGF